MEKALILLVDDNPHNLQVLGTLLASQYKIAVAVNGRDALELVQRQPPDLILLDIMLPDIDGFEVCQRLKATPAARDVPVIFLTARTDSADLVAGFAVGAVDYITKPFQAIEVLARVTTHLTIARLQQELQAVNAVLDQQIAARTADLRAANAQLQIELAERQRAETALKDQYSMLRSIIDSANALIFSVDRQYRYTNFNTKHAAMMHALYGAEIEIGQSLLAYMTAPEDRETARRNLARALAGEQLVEEAFSGEEFRSRQYFQVSHSPITTETGEIIGVAVLAQDMTERKRLEEALRESEWRYREIFNNVLDGLYLLEVTEDGRFRNLAMNPAFEQATGISRAQLIGKIIEDTVPAEVAAMVNAKYRRCVEAGQPIEEEAELDLPAGRRYFHSTLIPAYNKHGRVYRIIGISRDITERKQADEALRQSETLFRTSFENAMTGICLVGVDGRFLKANRKLCEILGYTDVELSQMVFNDVTHGEDREIGATFVKRALAGEVDNASFEKRYVHKDGHVVWVAVSSAMVRNRAGAPQYFITHIQDITGRKQAEQDLTLLNFALNTVHEAAFLITAAGRFHYVNDEACRALGYTRQEFLALNVSAVDPDFTMERWPGHWHDLKTQQTLLFESHHRAKDGRLVPVEINANYFEYAGQGYNLALARDITERKQSEEELAQHRERLEELVAKRTAALKQEIIERMRVEQELLRAKDAAEAANRAKSTFLANMSHELRTPLNAILGFAQLLQREPDLTPSRQEKLASILRGGEHLLRLINDVLDFSKIEAGRMTLHLTSVDLWDLLDMLEELLRERAARKGLQFMVQRAADVPRYINADEIKLRQILVNLVGNAIKFTEKGSVTVRILDLGGEILDFNDSHANHASQKSQIKNLKFEISDTGAGITPEDLATIFSSFEQGRQVYPVVEGTGLGLAISQAFVHLMGGEIRVASEVGKGSAFSFVIPVEPGHSAANRSSLAPLRWVIRLAPDQPEYRIVVVEDHPENRNFLTQLLRSVGLTVYEARNGQDLLTYLAHWQPHLIFMDMRMPVMDGYETTRRLRELEAQQAHRKLRIIALTASAFEEEKAAILAGGCDDVLRKPVKDHEIFEVLQRYLGVQYMYAESSRTTDPQQAPAGQHVLTPAALAALPHELVAQMEQAIFDGDVDLIDQTIETLRKSDRNVANALTALAQRFEYHTLLTLIQAAKEERQR